MATEQRPGYCSVADLRENIAGLTEDNQKVSVDFLTDLICRKSAIIDSYTCVQYVVPIVIEESPIAHSILKDICIALCKPPIADKLKVATPKMVGPNGNQYPVHEGLAKAMKLLALIKDGHHKLPDAIRCNECDIFFGGSYDGTEIDGVPDDINDFPLQDVRNIL